MRGAIPLRPLRAFMAWPGTLNLLLTEQRQINGFVETARHLERWSSLTDKTQCSLVLALELTERITYFALCLTEARRPECCPCLRRFLA